MWEVVFWVGFAYCLLGGCLGGMWFTYFVWKVIACVRLHLGLGLRSLICSCKLGSFV